MALRLLDVVLPEGSLDALKGVFREDVVIGGPWRHALIGGGRSVRVLIDADDSGRIVDAIEERCGGISGFHLLIERIEAAVPRPPEPEEKPEKPKRSTRSVFGQRTKGLSREELYLDATDMSRATRVYYATVLLSTVVASVGLIANNVAAIIGAMVIAPLLGPTIGLALSTTLADWALFRRALSSAATGLGLALALTVPLGAIFEVDPNAPEIVTRTRANLGDPILALAAGSAGVLALTTGVPISLVGVMVAVALLPPTAVLGLMLGGGHTGAAGGAALLLATNVTCIILAGALAFRAEGVRPGTWWEAEKARRATRITLVVLTVMLAAAVALILAQQG